MDPQVIQYKPEQVGEPQVEYLDNYYGDARSMRQEQADRYVESRERSRNGNTIIVVADPRQVQQLIQEGQGAGLQRWR
jgi:hypothetical protein